MVEIAQHYNEKYFEWQKTVGEFGGIVNAEKFADLAGPEKNLLDFGCGGGFLLKNLAAKSRKGVEINPSARENAKKLGIETVSEVSEIPDNWADLIISNHALEHTENPLQILRELREKLHSSGIITFVVPCDSIRYKWVAHDINQHLFSWSPMNFGNLFTAAGFHVQSVEPYMHKWPPHYMFLYRILGKTLFHGLCRIYSRIDRSWYQVKIIAKK